MRRSSGWHCTRFIPALCVAAAFLAAAGAADGPPRGGSSECASWPPYAAQVVLSYGTYTVCVWASLEDPAPSAYRVVTIERDGQLLVCVDWATGLGTLSGTDIDASGWPNVVIESYSGGAHCCFATYVYDLADTLVPVELPPSPGGNAAGEFVDLDGDGVFEVLTADDSFAYTYCAFAGSPAVRVVLAYDALEQRYVPASSRFPDLYADEIERDTQRARGALLASADLGWDGTPKCEVLPLVLDHLYSGDVGAAWDALDAWYPFSDKDVFRGEIEATVNASPYYAGAH
jgi:hypothetical protein